MSDISEGVNAKFEKLVSEIWEVCCVDESLIEVGKFECDINVNLTNDFQKNIQVLVEKYLATYAKTNSDIDTNEMTIRLTTDLPVFSSPRRLSYRDKSEVQKITNELLSKGIIRHSDSPYASAIVLVKKRVGRLGCALTIGN